MAEAASEGVEVKARGDAPLLRSEGRGAAAPGRRGLLPRPGGAGAPQPPFPAAGTGLAPGVVLTRGWSRGGRVRRRLLLAGQGVAGDLRHCLQAGLLGPGGQEEALEARGVGQQEQGPEAQGDEAGEEEKEEELLRQPQPPRGGRGEAGHFPHEHRCWTRGWGQSDPAGPLRPWESRHLSAGGSARGGRRGAPPGVGAPESFALRGLLLKFREFGASPPAPGRGSSSLGGARASEAVRLGARARRGRPRAAAFPPAAARPLLAAAGARGARAFPRCGGRRGRHMPSAAPRLSARRGARRPRPRSEPPSAPRPKVLASEAVSRGGRLRGRGGGGAGVSAALRERAGPAGSRQCRGLAIGTRLQLCSAAEQAPGREGRHF